VLPNAAVAFPDANMNRADETSRERALFLSVSLESIWIRRNVLTNSIVPAKCPNVATAIGRATRVPLASEKKGHF